MSQQYSLGNVDGATIHLLTGTFRTRHGTWRGSGIAGLSLEPITETVELVGKTADATLIAGITAIDALKEKAARFAIDPLSGDSVWLYSIANGESNSRRSFIYDLDIVPKQVANIGPLLGNGALYADLEITRHPLWEPLLPYEYTNSGMSSLGEMWTFSSNSAHGDAHGRISRLEIVAEADSGLSEFWFGIRKSAPGVTSFNPVWLLGNASPGTDATAGSGEMVVSFDTLATLASRLTMTVEQAALDDDYHHYVGRYLVLLRAKAGASTVCHARIMAGYATGEAPGELVEINGSTYTNYRLYPMGEIQIPPIGYRDAIQGAAAAKNFQISIQAERTSGAEDLTLGKLILIPSEHMVYCKGQALSSTGDKIGFYTFEDESKAVFKTSGTNRYGGLEYSFVDFTMPPEDVIGVFAGQAASYNLGGDCTINLDFYGRRRRFTT